jgi:2-haloacid dehalogenase
MIPKALAFDVFGTVVDWRSSVARESRGYLEQLGRSDIDPYHFADGWRARYFSTLGGFRKLNRPFVILDILHREMLEDWLRALAIDPAAI